MCYFIHMSSKTSLLIHGSRNQSKQWLPIMEMFYFYFGGGCMILNISPNLLNYTLKVSAWQYS